MTFGMKSLLAGMGLVAVALYLLVASPNGLATVALAALWVLASVLVLGGVVYGRGRTRAFALGALVPAGATIVALALVLFVWLLAGPWEIKDAADLLEHVDRMAFTMRVWSAGGAILTLLAGAVGAAASALFAPKPNE
jgi:hypothetical protein